MTERSELKANQMLAAQAALDPQTHPHVIALDQAASWFDYYAQIHDARVQKLIADTAHNLTTGDRK